jgi:hypothetical protein
MMEMSTYDGAYSNRNSDYGAKICSCYEDRVNSFCPYHGEKSKENKENTTE